MHSNFEGLIGVIRNQNMTQATWVLGPFQTRNFRPSVADPGSGAFLVAGLPVGIRIRDGKKSESGSGIRDEHPR